MMNPVMGRRVNLDAEGKCMIARPQSLHVIITLNSKGLETVKYTESIYCAALFILILTWFAPGL